jgi:adenine deaminase
VTIRGNLSGVAPGCRPADPAVRIGRLFDANGQRWHDDQAVVTAVGASHGSPGAHPGKMAERVDRRLPSPVPGFGEAHRQIEAGHLTPG